MALLFFIMMAVIGSVILSAASTGMSVVHNEKSADQERYALSSAADMIVDAMAGKADGTNGNAFSALDSTAESKNGTITYYATPELIYYEDEDTGEKYSDAELKNTYSQPALSWDFPTSKDSVQAQKLTDIRNILAAKILEKYWNGTLSNSGNGTSSTTSSSEDTNSSPILPIGIAQMKDWNIGETDNWSDLVSQNDSSVLKESFTITPQGTQSSENWPKNANTYVVQADLTMADSLDIMVKIHLQDQNLGKEVYTVYIPFNAAASVTFDGSEEDGNERAIYDEAGDDTKYIQQVKETREVTFTGFFWQDAKHATITTTDGEK